jgi:hypothetical protein
VRAHQIVSGCIFAHLDLHNRKLLCVTGISRNSLFLVLSQFDEIRTGAYLYIMVGRHVVLEVLTVEYRSEVRDYAHSHRAYFYSICSLSIVETERQSSLQL